MPHAPACPDRAALTQFLNNRLNDDRAGELENHLLECESCCQLMDELEAGDALVDSVRGAGRVELPLDATVQAVMARLKTVVLSSAAHEETLASQSLATDDAWGLQELLDPAQAAGELGRFADYRVLRVLGAGGMGIVFDAEDANLQRHVAIKVIKPHLAKSDEQRKRFLREARAAAAIEHPHIVPVYQVGEHRKLPYLVMQLLKGESLQERLARGRGLEKGSGFRVQGSGKSAEHPLPLAEILRIGRETADALAAAHERGLIHRDVKPGNIWLEAPAGWVKLVDFGLAHVADDTHLTQTGTILGTPAYMSPEQARGDTLDARSDLFSLGAVLYRLATGQTPFAGSSTLAVVTALATQTPRPVGELNSELPPELARLIMRLLAKKPADRFPTAASVADAIRQIEERRADQARQAVNAARRGNAPSRRRPRWPWAVAAAAAFALVAGVVVVIRDKEGREVASITVPEGGKVDIQSLPESSPAPRPAAPSTPPPAPSSGDHEPRAADLRRLPTPGEERAAANWIVENGGSVANSQLQSISMLPISEVRLAGALSDEALARLERFPRLTALDLQGVAVAQADLARLARLTNLRRLNLRDSGFTDAGVEQLAELQRLEWLDLSGTRITDAGLAALAKACPRLHHLSLDETGVGDAGLPALATLAQLDRLDLAHTAVSAAGLAKLKPLTGLLRLTLTNADVSEAALADLHTALVDCWIVGQDGQIHSPPVGDDADRTIAAALLKNCRRQLSLTTDGVNDVWLNEAKSLPAEPFRIRGIRFGDNCETDTSDIELCAGLRQLAVFWTTLANDDELARLKSLSKIEELQLERSDRLTDEGLSALVGMPRLRLLSIAGRRGPRADWSWLDAAPYLEHLHLQGELLDDSLVGRLAALPNLGRRLKSLSLDEAPVTGAGLARLKPFRRLSRLRIGRLKVSNADLARLAELPELEHLELWILPINADGLRRLTGLPRLFALRIWQPDGTVVGDNEFAALGGLTTLESVNILASPRLTDAGLAPVAALPQLRALSLEKVAANISDAGLASLAQSPHLIELDLLGAARITDQGVAHLHALKSLRLMNIDARAAVSDEAVAALKAGLPGLVVNRF